MDLLFKLQARITRAQTMNPPMERIWLEIYDLRTILQTYERVRYCPDESEKFLDKLDDKNARYAKEARTMKQGFEKEKVKLKEARSKALRERLSVITEGNLMESTGFNKSDPLIQFAQHAYKILGACDAVVYADKVLTIWEKMWEVTRRADKMIGGDKNYLQKLWDTVHRRGQSEQAIIDAQEAVKSIKSEATDKLRVLQSEESTNVNEMKDIAEELVHQKEHHPSRQSKRIGQY